MKDSLAFVGVVALCAAAWLLKGCTDNAVVRAKDETIQTLKDELTAKQLIIDKYEAQSIDHENPHPVRQTTESLDTGTPEDIYPKDNGFDAQDLGSGPLAYQVFGPLNNIAGVQQPTRIPNRTPWKFGSGNSGVTANNSGFLMTDAKNGDSDGATSTCGQAGFLEYKGSSISQSIDLKPGTYIVVFDWEGRPQYQPNKISVALDDTVLFTGTPSNSDHFESVKTKPVTFSIASNRILVFRGLGGTRNLDGDTFIDNIKIRPVAPDSTAGKESGE